MRTSSAVRAIVFATIVFAAATAHAEERITNVSLGGIIGVVPAGEPQRMPGVPTPDVAKVAEPVTGARLTLSWERARLPLPLAPGYAADGSLVPELILGTNFEEERAEGMVGAGLRAELRVSQREQGLLRVSAQAAFYLAARGMVIGKDREGLGEFVVGEYIYLGRRNARIGFEGGASVRRRSDTMERGTATGVVAQVYLSWAM